jgi:hypothetical protein
VEIKRYHTHKKEVLRFADLDWQSCGLENEFADFMGYVDDIERPDLEDLTLGQWKKLYAFLKKMSDKDGVNYCIYQNKSSVFFDVTSNCAGSEDEISEDNEGPSLQRGQNPRESSVEKLKRYKYEVDQLDLKIAHLQERRREYLKMMDPLKMELASVLDDLSRYFVEDPNPVKFL